MEELVGHRLDIGVISDDLVPALDYWQSLLPGNKIGPSWNGFELLNLPPELLPYTLVVDIEGNRRELRYRYFGSKIAEAFNADYSGQVMGDLPDLFTSHSKVTYGWVIEEQRPILITLEYRRDETSTQLMELLRLPLSNDGNRVDTVVSVARLFAEEWELTRLLEGDRKVS